MVWATSTLSTLSTFISKVFLETKPSSCTTRNVVTSGSVVQR